MEVYLNIYDYSSWNRTLEKCGMGLYHTGVEINNIQYCYCVIDSNPDVSGVVAIQPQTAEFTFNRKLFIGTTRLSREQIHRLMVDLGRKYTCGQYHIFRNNCNHFSNEVALTLTAQGLAGDFFKATNCLKYVCCCLPQGMVSGQWELERLRQVQLELAARAFDGMR